MSETPGIGRRRFLAVGSGIGISLLLAPFGRRSLVAFAPMSDARRLKSLLAHRGSAAEVGREYLRKVPHEAAPRTLVRLIAEGLPRGRRSLRTAGDAELRRLLSIRTSQDFAGDDTIDLRGWIMGRTEARLCALAALV